MRATIVLSFCLSLVGTSIAAPINLDFDAAYMVASAGSTDPVDEFDFDGPAPLLYLDLPDGALSSFSAWSYSDWYHSPDPVEKFSASAVHVTDVDKHWISPTAEIWESSRAVGDWHIDASHQLVRLIIIYGAGAPVVWANGSQTVEFSVVSSMSADRDNDNDVDGIDFLMIQSEDSSEISAWESQYGSSAVSGTTVPEPSVSLLILAAAGVLLSPSSRSARKSNT